MMGSTAAATQSAFWPIHRSYGLAVHPSSHGPERTISPADGVIQLYAVLSNLEGFTKGGPR